MDFFSEATLTEELEGQDFNEQQNSITSLGFSNFLKHEKVIKFLASNKCRPTMPAMRYTYLFYFFKKIGDFIGCTNITDYYHQHVFSKSTKLNLTLSNVYNECCAMKPKTMFSISLLIESVTRGQSVNGVWNTLRDGIISSSKYQWAIKQQNSTKKIFQPWPIVNDYYFAGPLAFGLRCESTVKTLLTTLIINQCSVFSDCGFLQCPEDGIFGVSLDLCTNVRLDKNGTLIFNPGTCIYEIKCRFKYLFSKSTCDGLYLKYKQLYDEPCKETFIKFINGVSKPAVEYVENGRLPSEGEFLITSDSDWNLQPKKKRKLTVLHKPVKECIDNNMFVTSKVYVFTDPSVTQGDIKIKETFSIDVFTNPRHSYFYQILLQYKVVRDYIRHEPSTCGKLGVQRNYLVSAFFRKRNLDDPQYCYIGDITLDRSVEIPVLLLVTPVYIPHAFAQNSINRAARFWEKSAGETFGFTPWVSSSVFASEGLTP